MTKKKKTENEVKSTFTLAEVESIQQDAFSSGVLNGIDQVIQRVAKIADDSIGQFFDKVLNSTGEASAIGISEREVFVEAKSLATRRDLLLTLLKDRQDLINSINGSEVDDRALYTEETKQTILDSEKESEDKVYSTTSELFEDLVDDSEITDLDMFD